MIELKEIEEYLDELKQKLESGEWPPEVSPRFFSYGHKLLCGISE